MNCNNAITLLKCDLKTKEKEKKMEEVMKEIPRFSFK